MEVIYVFYLTSDVLKEWFQVLSPDQSTDLEIHFFCTDGGQPPKMVFNYLLAILAL